MNKIQLTLTLGTFFLTNINAMELIVKNNNFSTIRSIGSFLGNIRDQSKDTQQDKFIKQIRSQIIPTEEINISKLIPYKQNFNNNTVELHTGEYPQQNKFIQSIRSQNTPIEKTSILRLIQRKKIFNNNIEMQYTSAIKSKNTQQNQRLNTASTTKKNRKPYIKHALSKPYVCTIKGCSARFVRQTELDRHGVVHTRVKAFTCANCGYKFSFKCNLNKHIKNQTCK